MNDIGNTLVNTGDYSSSIEILLQTLEKSEKLKDENMKATSWGNMSEAYSAQGDHRQAISYTSRSLFIDMANHDTPYLHKLVAV